MKKDFRLPISAVLWVALLLGVGAACSQDPVASQTSAVEFPINDSNMAIRYAEPLLVAKYGPELSGTRPLVATLENDSVWYVSGTLPDGFAGGTPYIFFNRYTGKVIEISHGA